MLALFLVAGGLSLARAESPTAGAAFTAGLYSLLAVVLFRFTAGNVWRYAVEYRDAGGAWSDLPFLAPFVVAAAVGAAVLLPGGSLGSAAWAAFWGFVVAAGLASAAVWLAVGYRESGRSDPLG
ncbi:hypothetical protein HUG12_07000 [Halorarum salinum]|uniref:Uncharacterized protein n=1 Tax=Halorarum salinum TaxID=2743089 RepID=A0A7D5LDA7_9EURY|nr:hypothetical protein HUG12_07000 [Halobaculum salinum]